MHGKKDGSDRLRSAGSTANGTANSSLHRFSVDALAGTGSAARKRSDLNVTDSDDEGSINSWDQDLAGCSEDEDDIDVDDVGARSPTAVSTTSDSSRGGSSPSALGARLGK